MKGAPVLSSEEDLIASLEAWDTFELPLHSIYGTEAQCLLQDYHKEYVSYRTTRQYLQETFGYKRSTGTVVEVQPNAMVCV